MSDGEPSPVLTAALTALRDGFNQAFPYRDHASDGWIGDAAHQATVSGHNPDDTAGVTAEYSDADTKPEVRAIDVDSDLNCPGVTMQDVVNRILATPNDLMRLRYIIYNRVIWSKTNGWRPAEYTGLSPHIEHAHFSGDPLYDENNGEWSVATLGDDMTYTEGQMQAFPWQYSGRGIGENDGTTIKKSTLAYFDEILHNSRAILAKATAIPPDLVARLDAILAAAKDDAEPIVVLPPNAISDLEEIKAAIEGVPKAVVDYEVTRLAE